jgi:RimJ/RimL family protein N-acetyltransferase
MISLYEHPAFDPDLKELFGSSLPNSPALWAVLKGNHTGKAVVDRIQKPGQCVVRTDAALTYFSNQTQQAFLNDAIAYFRDMGPVWLVWPHKTYLQPPEINDAIIIHRLEFFNANPDIFKRIRNLLPEGCVIKEINAQLLERCKWKAEMEFYTGSSRNFLRYGVGLCLLQGDEIIVEAYASALGKTRAEIGAITREAYRGQGYAPIACAHLINVCEQLGYQAYWSCEADHTASIRVAQKLGFQQKRSYVIYNYGPQC